MRSENDACTSTQIPLRLELWDLDLAERHGAPEKEESRIVIIDLVSDDDPTAEDGVVVIQL
jgi:hypothetical protein